MAGRTGEEEVICEFEKTPALRQFFADFPHDPAFLAYALADEQSRFWADSPTSPSIAAMIPRKSVVGFAAGNRLEASSLIAALRGSDLLRLRPSVILSLPEINWTSGSLMTRVDYDYPRADSPPRSSIANLHPLDDELLRATDVSDIEFDRAYFREMDGFGYAAVDCGRVVSLAWAPAIAGWAEIGVGTAASHRNCGLARAVGAAVVNEAILRNLTPHVSTDQRNTAAIAWARSLGFGNERLHDWIVLAPAE